MLCFSQQQLDAIQQSVLGELIAKLSGEIGIAYHDEYSRLSEVELSHIVSRWVRDAISWGLASQEAISAYVHASAKNHIAIDPLDVRLTAMLRFDHGHYLQPDRIQRSVSTAMQFAHRYPHASEDLIAAIATVLCGAAECEHEHTSWIDDTLRGRYSETQAITRLRQGAIARGWII